MPALLIAYSIYWVSHTNTRFNLRKTNAANEEPIGRLDNGRISLGISARPIASSFYQLEQRDGRSPDWMPGRSTKYIVVDLCLSVQTFNRGDEVIDGGLGVAVIPGC